MRTSTVFSALLAGGALATPVRKLLEERALVVDWVTATTVVWVTEGQPLPTPAAASKKAAVAGYQPHHHAHAHAQAQPATTTTSPAPAPPPASPKPVAPAPAPAPAPEQKAAQPPAEQPTTTSTPPAPAPSKPASNSGSSNAPTSYPENLDTTSDVYKALVLQHHNVHRANHSADDLVWDDTLASYAEQTAKTCVWGHDL